MERVYKVLLPVYRSEEMKKEIAQEWLLDSRGQSALNLPLLQKLLFRLAQEWAVNFDIDEYLEFLDILYSRIIEKVVVGENDKAQVSSQVYLAHLHLDFPREEVVSKEKEERNIGKQDLAGWLLCEEDEPVDDDYNYRYIEDKKEMVLRKYKKRKDQDHKQDLNEVAEPIFYRERAVWFQDQKPLESETVYDRLTAFDNVVPLGYGFEQFLNFLKTDVQKKIEENRQHNKLEIKRVKREAREKNEEVDQAHLEPYLYNKDLGMIEMKGLYQQHEFQMSFISQISSSVRLTDTLYCWFRQILREGMNIRIRHEQEHPMEGSRGKTRMVGNEDPHQFINTNCYNPSLERRIHYRLITLPGQKNAKWINVNYQLDTREYRTAQRSDVTKVETSKNLANKPQELKSREIDFLNDTPYKDVKRIMLQTKFQDFADSRLEADEKEVARMKKIVEQGQKQKAKALQEENITVKGLQETYEDKSTIKLTRGPFHQIESLQGMREDHFISCEYQDIIDAANEEPLKLLVIGKPRSGKSTICQLLSQEFDLVHVNVENWIKKLMDKIKEHNENPPDEPEEGEPPLPPWLTELEEIVQEQLKWSEGPNPEQIEQILKDQIQSPESRTKGFILDLSFAQRDKPWGEVIQEQEWLGEKGQFTYIIDLELSDDEILRRVEGMLANPKFGSVYSQAEIKERNKPKVVNEDEEEQEEEEEGEVDKGPTDISTLVTRPNDTLEAISSELEHYNKNEKRPLEKLTTGLISSQIIRIDAAGLTPECIQASISIKMRQDEGVPLRPIAIKLEEGGAFKDLLTAEQPENALPRKWSLWKQTDPVALSKGKVIQGVAEFAASFNNNVFCFATEENLKEFCTEPKKFLKAAPQMPKEFRILLIGQKGIGKTTQAKKLADLYNWPIFDYPELVQRRLDELNSLENHIPNNFIEGGKIGMSEQELAMINDGKPFPSWKFIPWLLDELGFPLCKRKPPPEPEKNEEEEQEEELTPVSKRKRDMELKKKQAELDKKRKEEEEKKRAKEERAKLREEALAEGKDLVELGLEESEEEIIIDDLPIDDLVLQPNEDGSLPYVGGFILMGFPETEEHVNKLKEHGVDFDSVVYLQDTNEDDPGAELKQRVKEDYLYDFEIEAEVSQKQLAVAKEFINEEIVKEISANGSVEDTFIRIRAEIDPFFLQADNPEDVRNSGDVEEEQRKIERGNFADYCPVTFVRDGWLVKGNPEQELTVRGKVHLFAGEKELEEFKFNPEKFMISDKKQLPLQPPNPKVMICGLKGAGVTTQIQNLCERFNLEEFQLKDEYLKKLNEEKFQRQRRRLLDRGFKPPQPVEEEEEEGKPKEELTHFQTLIKGDAEVEEDPDDFEKGEYERDLMKGLIEAQKSLIIDGNWRDVPEEQVTTSLEEILVESRRLPEIIIHLVCSADNTGKRMIDEQKIQAEYEKQMEQMLAEIAKERKEARAAREEELIEEVKEDEEKDEQQKQDYVNEQLQEWDDQRDLQEEETEKERVENEEGPNLDKLREEENEKLKETLENDQARLDKMKEDFEGKVAIHTVNTDISPDYVFIKILNILKLHFEKRKSYIERELCDSLKPEEVKYYEQSYNFKQSKFGIHCPVNMANPVKTKKHAVLYRERIYFPGNDEDKAKFLAEPFKFASGETVPLDVKYAPRIFVHGLPKSGKTTISRVFQDKANLVHLKINKVVQEYVEQDSIQAEKLRQRMRKEGAILDDETQVKLLVKRINYKDCLEHGFILEDFPRTRKQAILLAEAGVVPTTVLNLRMNNEHCYKRSQDMSKFGNNRIILSQKIDIWREQVPFVLSFYQRFYHNVREIDAARSKWYVQDAAFAFVQEANRAKQQFAKNYFNKDKGAVCDVENFAFDRALCKQSLSSYKYFCPVTWLNLKEIQKCAQNTENCVLYKEKFYYFASSQERALFKEKPMRYLKFENFPKELPQILKNTKAAELNQGQKAIEGHCPVVLVDGQAVQKGNSLLIVKYSSFAPFIMKDQESLLKFFKLPAKYSRARLPTKMPAKKDEVSLFELQKDDETMITYMEESVGKVVTQGLREVSENRLKYPGLSVKETMLKLFALFLKTMNPANTDYMKNKYQKKMQLFIERCEMPEELYDLAEEKEKKDKKGKWPKFKEEYFNELGAKFDNLVQEVIPQEKQDNFASFIR